MPATPDPTPLTIARIERLVLWTDALERLRDFYSQLLGAHAAPLSEDPATGLRSVRLDFCGVQLELIQSPATAERAVSEPQRSGYAQFGFALGSADAVDELSGRLLAAEHRVVEPPRRTGEGRYECLALDPDGNRISLTV
jgi:lactoylglutathione lyase